MTHTWELVWGQSWSEKARQKRGRFLCSVVCVHKTMRLTLLCLASSEPGKGRNKAPALRYLCRGRASWEGTIRLTDGRIGLHRGWEPTLASLSHFNLVLVLHLNLVLGLYCVCPFGWQIYVALTFALLTTASVQR